MNLFASTETICWTRKFSVKRLLLPFSMSTRTAFHSCELKWVCLTKTNVVGIGKSVNIDENGWKIDTIWCHVSGFFWSIWHLFDRYSGGKTYPLPMEVRDCQDSKLQESEVMEALLVTKLL